MEKTTQRIGLLVLVAATVSGYLSGCRQAEVATAKTPTPVRVRVVSEPVALGATRYSGVIEPAAKVDLAFKVGGYVREVAEAKGHSRKLQEGDWVTKGTILAVVNDADYRQRISGARASHAEAVASERQTQVDFERARKLLADNVISQADFDNTAARRDMAMAKTAAARSHVSESDLSLADCTLRAPFDGVVLRRNVEVGTLAAPGTLAFSIADTRTVKVIFGAPDSLLGRLRIGDKLDVRLEALGKELSADITRISPSADTRSRTFDVEASLENREDRIKVGMIVSIKASSASGSGARRWCWPSVARRQGGADPRDLVLHSGDRLRRQPPRGGEGADGDGAVVVAAADLLGAHLV